MKKSSFVLMFMLSLAACSSSQSTTDAPQERNRPEGKRAEGNRQGPPNTAEIFKMMDSNEDGKLAKSEVKGPLAKDFTKIDVDGDGFLSKAEVEKAPKPKGGQRPPRN